MEGIINIVKSSNIVSILIFIIIIYIVFKFLNFIGKILGGILAIIVILYGARKLGLDVPGVESVYEYLDGIIFLFKNIFKGLILKLKI